MLKVLKLRFNGPGQQRRSGRRLRAPAATRHRMSPGWIAEELTDLFVVTVDRHGVARYRKALMMVEAGVRCFSTAN